MMNTKKCMLNLLGDVANTKMTDLEILNNLSEDAQVAKVFVDHVRLITQTCNKYYSVDNDTKVSISLECIAKACKNYDYDRGAKLITLVTYYINQDLKRILRDENNDKRKANNDADSLNAEETQDRLKDASACDDTSRLEIFDLLEKCDFTENEKYYIKAIIADANILESEIARELNVCRATAMNTRRKIKAKLVSIGYTA